MEDGKELSLVLWDTSGQESYRLNSLKICKSVQGILICFDLAKYYPFGTIKLWLDEIKIYENNENIPILLVGNKSDKLSDREITKEEGIEFAKKCSIPYYCEASAKYKINIENAILFFANKVYKNVKEIFFN